MIHIGICDDEKGMQKRIYEIVQHELFKYDDAGIYILFFRKGSN